MQNAKPVRGGMVALLLLLSGAGVDAQDWPQWRGPNRDNKVVGFTVPQTWPKTLTQKWKVNVGLGDASPDLVGDKLYVFTRQGGDEVTRCLDAGSGKTLWEDKYKADPAKVPGGQHTGPRSWPAVADGKVCTLGASGVLSCLDAQTGKVVWRKDSQGKPRFFTASSPLIVDGKCIAYVGGPSKGEIVAYDLASGTEKWKWPGDGPAYGSPVLMGTVNTKQLVTLSDKSLIGIDADDGKLLWQVPYQSQYNSGTPIVDRQTVICSGPKAGTVAFKVEKQGEGFAAKQLWKKTQAAGIYNTPVLKDGLLFGLASSGGRGGPTNFFCMNAQTGDVLWTDKSPRGECGEVLDAGPVLLALTSNGELVVFKPSNKDYEEVAKYKVSDKTGNDGPWAYPILTGNRVYVKDRDSLALWTF